MRPLEINLLIIALAFLSATGLRLNRNWHRSFAVMVIIAAILQLWLEGGRWQILPLYILALVAARKIARPSRMRLRYLLPALALTLLGGLLSWSLPVMETPAYPELLPIGIQHLELTDSSRKQTTKGTEKSRRLMISIWYPAAANSLAQRTPYLPHFAQLQDEYANKLDWPAWLISHLRLGKGQARIESQAAQGSFPLLIYSHGLYRNRFEAVTRMELLAAHGYVVVAVDHPLGADFVLFPDGEIVRFESNRKATDTLEDIDKKRLARIATWKDDLHLVLNQIRAGMPELIPGEIIDMNRIAALGYSNGGSTALALAAEDASIDAVINLDGTPRGAVTKVGLEVPVLMLESELQARTDEQLARWGISRETYEAPRKLLSERMRKIVSGNCEPAYQFRIIGTRHSNFTDAPLISPWSSELGIGGPIDSRRAAKIIDELVVNFLALTIKDEKAKPLSRMTEQYPELEQLARDNCDRRTL